MGYLTPEVGIIEVRDSKGESKKVKIEFLALVEKINIQVSFHIDDVWVFKKPLLQYQAQSTSSLLPVGQQTVH